MYKGVRAPRGLNLGPPDIERLTGARVKSGGFSKSQHADFTTIGRFTRTIYVYAGIFLRNHLRYLFSNI
jgi:hypothetical protein